MKIRIIAAIIAVTMSATTLVGCAPISILKRIIDKKVETPAPEPAPDPMPTPEPEPDPDPVPEPDPIPGPDINTSTKITDNDIQVDPLETSTLEFVNYTTSEGYFNLVIPSNWSVETDPGDILSYTIRMYDPEVPSRQVIFSATTASYKSQEAIDIANNYNYTGDDLSYTAINPKGTSSSYFKNSKATLAHYGLKKYEEIDKLCENGWGGDILQGSAVYADGTEVEGLFTVSTFDVFGTMDYFGVDISPWMDEGLTIITAPTEDFPTWQPILVAMFGSIQMTDAYLNARAQAWGNIQRNSQIIAQMANDMSNTIMSGWEERNNTYDILSQQYSDATLGRDRVYDTETGYAYYTDLGWYDNYDGDRLVYVDEGSSYYNAPVYGTIY